MAKETPYQEWSRVQAAAAAARRRERKEAGRAARAAGPEAYRAWLREQRRGRCR